jgi:hypothetical protein
MRSLSRPGRRSRRWSSMRSAQRSPPGRLGRQPRPHRPPPTHRRTRRTSRIAAPWRSRRRAFSGPALPAPRRARRPTVVLERPGAAESQHRQIRRRRPGLIPPRQPRPQQTPRRGERTATNRRRMSSGQPARASHRRRLRRQTYRPPGVQPPRRPRALRRRRQPLASPPRRRCRRACRRQLRPARPRRCPVHRPLRRHRHPCRCPVRWRRPISRQMSAVAPPARRAPRRRRLQCQTQRRRRAPSRRRR